MKLSTKGRYGVRAMLDLALNYGKGPIFLKDIAKRQEISFRYLEQLIIPLKASGLIKSSRGSKGGYELARPPWEIKLSEIIYVLEGSLAPVECVNYPQKCHRSINCVTREVWIELYNSIKSNLESTTLQELINLYFKKQANILDYSI